MTEEEWQAEIKRREDIISALEGVQADFLFFDAKLQAIKLILGTGITAQEKNKLISKLVWA